jgi:hypothetical protein
MYCHPRLTLDAQSQRISSVNILAWHDPGWTPPFRVRDYPLAGLRVWDRDIWSFAWDAGEASPISGVRTEARHPNSEIKTIPGRETVLVNGIIKFRAGAHTGHIGWGKASAVLIMCPGSVRDGTNLRWQPLQTVRPRLDLSDTFLVPGWCQGSDQASSRRSELPHSTGKSMAAAEPPSVSTQGGDPASAHD